MNEIIIEEQIIYELEKLIDNIKMGASYETKQSLKMEVQILEFDNKRLKNEKYELKSDLMKLKHKYNEITTEEYELYLNPPEDEIPF